jgi:diacylglycerol kinase (ATP)
MNTAFEALCDRVSPEHHPLVQRAKDVAAGAVLVCAMGAATIGLIVFGPRIVDLVR